MGDAPASQRLEELRCREDVATATITKSVSPPTFEQALADAGDVVDIRVWVDRDGAVLLVREAAAPEVWIEPGGTPEAEEDWDATAVREVAEETGIECSVVDVRGIVDHTIRHEEEPHRTAVLHQVFVRATYRGGTPAPVDTEIKEAR